MVRVRVRVRVRVSGTLISTLDCICNAALRISDMPYGTVTV